MSVSVAATDDPDAKSRRRSFLVVLLLLAAGAALMLTAAAKGWSVADQTTTGFERRESNDAPAIVRTAGLLALAAIAGVGATYGWLRRLVGAVVTLIGGLTIAIIMTSSRSSDGKIWVWAAATGAALVVIAGVVVAATGHRWTTMSRRYSRSRTGGPEPAELWRSLDAGEDPTDVPPGGARLRGTLDDQVRQGREREGDGGD